MYMANREDNYKKFKETGLKNYSYKEGKFHGFNVSLVFLTIFKQLERLARLTICFKNKYHFFFHFFPPRFLEWELFLIAPFPDLFLLLHSSHLFGSSAARDADQMFEKKYSP